MKKIIIISIAAMAMSTVCKAQCKQITANDSDFIRSMKADTRHMICLTIEGLKQIRHDALYRLKFGYAHEIKLEIRKEQLELLKLSIN